MCPDDVDDDAVIAVMLWYRRRKRNLKKGNRRMWVHDINKERNNYGVMAKLYAQLVDDEEKFFNFLRMSNNSFEELLSLVSNKIQRMDTNYRKAITPRERLAVTLRFLATGEDFTSLHYQFRMGAGTVREIVYSVCDALWANLQELEMPQPTEETFKNVARDFDKRWNFPHCIGAIDGKHIKIECPPNSGSAYFNYKHTFSIVLQGVCDANSKFLAVDVGDFGRHSDGGVLKHSSFGRALLGNKIPIPHEQSVHNENLPYVLLGDEAYPLITNLMRPFPRKPRRNIRSIYNSRHSRARRTIECAFGILARKWRVLLKTMKVTPDNARKITLACCVLHNFVKNRDGKNVIESTTEVGDSNPKEEDVLISVSATQTCMTGRHSQDAIDVRNKFAHLFVTSHIVPWQWKAANVPEPTLIDFEEILEDNDNNVEDEEELNDIEV